MTEPRLRVYRSSRVDVQGRVLKGSEAGCTDAEVARTTLELQAVLDELPPVLRPRGAVEVHLGPIRGARSLRPVEVVENPAALLVDDPRLARSVWLHELMHLRLRGARPDGLLERRVLIAFEEAVADFAAALVLQAPRVGMPELEERDLLAERDQTLFWEALAIPKEGRFEPHALGLPLSRLLFATRREELLVAIAEALSSAEPYPAELQGVHATLSELVRRCPKGERYLLSRVIGDWLPEPLRGSSFDEMESQL